MLHLVISFSLLKLLIYGIKIFINKIIHILSNLIHQILKSNLYMIHNNNNILNLS